MRPWALMAAAGLLAAGCSGPTRDPSPGHDPTPDQPPATADLTDALSDPVEDQVYPAAGDPRLDTLQYDLDLTWDPDTDTLDGAAEIEARAARTARRFVLDLGAPLAVSAVSVDGEAVPYTHRGETLLVRQPIRADDRLTVQVSYRGTPEPVPAPATRPDLATLGWTITEDGAVWTMQEPFGAYTWYPVNDQPSDKALYDFTITAPAGWTGIANGRLLGQEDQGDTTVTRWQLASPASSYLITIAIGEYTQDTVRTDSGLPVTLWAPVDDTTALTDLRAGAAALDWIEGKLGPYPFDTAGLVLTDSDSAMETQTLVTLGNNSYVRSEMVIVHELIHQWYGDQITPRDWRDVWMNEGMTTYLQFLWQDEHSGPALSDSITEAGTMDQELRRTYGPPADYDPAQFGSLNVYYSAALMWHQLRLRIGEKAFWDVVREWPATHEYGNASREEYVAWIEDRTGEELGDFFDAWLLGESTPPWTARDVGDTAESPAAG